MLVLQVRGSIRFSFEPYEFVYISIKPKSIIPGNPEMVKLLLDSGADINVNLKDSAGDSPIIYAAYGIGEGNYVAFCFPNSFATKKTEGVYEINRI